MAVAGKKNRITKSQLGMLNIYGVFSAALLFMYAIQLFGVNFMRIGALDRFMNAMHGSGGVAKLLISVLGINIFLSPVTLSILAFMNFRWNSQGYKFLGTVFIASVVVFLSGLIASR